MNIKFKMPKIGRNLSKKGLLKELLLTVVATTISIILTFGTAHIIEQRQKKAAGRQTAMMVIHDIDNNIQQLYDIVESEKKSSELAQYVISHLDDLNQVPADTLAMVYNYLAYTEEFVFDDSKEKIFHSSPESWRNIDNPQFIDLVQQFYYERSKVQAHLNSSNFFKEPITPEEQYEQTINTPGFFISENLPAILGQVLNDKKVQLFLYYSPVRQNQYSEQARVWKRVSDQLKFILGITDEELSEYVENQKRSGRRIKERELIGKWTETSADQEHVETIEFRRNHTFSHVGIHNIPSAVYTGHMTIHETLLGTWELDGDSLIRVYQPGSDIELDKSQIKYSEEMKDTVSRLVKQMEDQVTDRQEAEKKATTSAIGRIASTIYIDPSDSKIELKKDYTDEQGRTESVSIYMVRGEK